MPLFNWLVLIAITICPLVAQNVSVSTPPVPPGRLVKLESRRIHINCTGKGGPVVILLHGSGAYSFDWALVQPEVAKLTRVCSYDRAGHAWSDLAPTAQTYSEMAEDLHQLLKSAGEKTPVVLVGHSGGGGLVRVFAAQYEKEVAGAVLVETGGPDNLNIINGKLIRITADTLPPEPSSYTWPGTRPPNPEAKVEAPYDKLPGEAQTFRLWSEREGKTPASRSSIDVRSEDELREAQGRGIALFGQKPLVVLYRSKDGYHTIKGIITADQVLELRRDRLRSIAALQKLSSNSIGIVAEKSGHDIHLDQPSLVIEATRKVIESIRDNRPLSTFR